MLVKTGKTGKYQSFTSACSDNTLIHLHDSKTSAARLGQRSSRGLLFYNLSLCVWCSPHNYQALLSSEARHYNPGIILEQKRPRYLVSREG